MSGHLISYVLKAAIRDRLLLALLILIGLGLSLSLFTGSAAVIEKEQFTLVFTAGSLRIIGVAGLVLFIVFYMRRTAESRDFEYMLSRPLSRPEFLMAHAGAFTLLAVIIAVMVTATIAAAMAGSQMASLALWAGSYIVELIIMANTALFFGLVLTSAAAAAMATFGFYVLSRMIGHLLGIVDAGYAFPFKTALTYAMELISVFIPRLDLMAQTSWLVYGLDDIIGLGFVVIQGAVFTFLILAAALIDLEKRQF